MVIGFFGAAIAEEFDVSRSISLQVQAIREKIKSEPKPVAKETPKTSTPVAPETKVLVRKVVIRTQSGKSLSPEIENQAYKAIVTQADSIITRSQMQADINALFALGYFTKVEAEPEDTDIGVRVTFVVEPNPVLKSVTTEGTQVLEKNVVNRIFGSQIGKVTNLKNIQAGVKELEKYYQDKGYVVAQVVDIKATPEGNINLVISEGVIEEIKLAFLNDEGKTQNKDGTSVRGKNGDLINRFMAKNLKIKVGQIFNKDVIQVELQRLFKLGIFDDLNIGLAPGIDPRKVIVTFNVKERNPFSASFGFGLSTTKGVYPYLDMEDITIKAALDPNNSDLIESLDELYKLCYEAEKSLRLANNAPSPIDLYRNALNTYRQCLFLAQEKKNLNIELYALIKIASIYEELLFKSKAMDIYSQAFKLAIHNRSEIFQSPNIIAKPLIYYVYTSLQSIFIQSLGEYQNSLFLISQNRYFPREGLNTNINKNNSHINASLAFYNLRKFLFYYDLDEQYVSGKYLNEGIDSFLQILLNSKKNDVNKSKLDIKKISQILLRIKDYYRLGSQTQKLRTNNYLAGLGDLVAYIYDLTNNQSNVNGKTADQLTNILSKLKFVFDYYKGNQYAEISESEIALNYYYTSLVGLQEFKSYRDLISKQLKEILAEFAKQNRLSDSLTKQVNSLDNQFKQLLVPFLLDLGKIDYINVLENYSLQANLEEIGDSLSKLNQKSEAITYYQKSRNILPELNLFISNMPVPISKSDYVKITNKIGRNQRELGQFDLSIKSFSETLFLTRKKKDSFGEANSYLEIAMTEQSRNNLSESISNIEKAIAIIESTPLSLDTIEQSKDQSNSQSNKSQFDSYIELTSYFAERQKFYGFYVDMLMKMHRQNPNKNYNSLALQVSERSRGRSLLALLNRSDRYTSSDIRKTKDNIRLQGLENTLKLSEIQQQILDDNTVLLEYSLGEERSYLFVVSRTDIQSYELPKKADIENSARTFYDYITVPSLRVRSAKTLKAGQELSQILLGSAASRIANKRLLIVADGILQYIPFSALPSPIANSENQNADKQAIHSSLLSQNEIVMLPSASVFASLRKNKSSNFSPSKTLLIFADPVFGYADDRLMVSSDESQSTKKTIPLAGGYQPLLEELRSEQLYPRLPSTQNEADEISSIIPATNTTQLTGFDASRQAAIDQSVGQYRIVHFATHGTLDAKRPERSGILLSFLNNRGDFQQRSLLSTPDVFNLKLSADLVVLSGCRTGLGKEINGEGLIGLTGGFMYAGAKSVVVSLWSVDDEATAALMKLFYKGILQDKLPPSQALRNAQLEIRKDPRWQSPFYWAGFILQGEWK
jgi:CHAT domain-containing protein